MAIGTALAIGLGASAIGGAVSASSNKKAASKAAAQSQQATDQSIALQRESRDFGLQRLDPYNNRGQLAGDQINALLGLGGGGFAQQLPTGQPNALSQFNAGSPYGLGDTPGYNATGFGGGILNNAAALSRNEGLYSTQGGLNGGYVGTPVATGGAASAGNPQAAAQSAFNQFRNSTNYQFRLGEGLDAVNSGYAGNGVLQSGAAMRGINDYAQNMASGELGNYLALLSQQQNVGAGAASSAAGVSQNFANNAGSLITNNANNQANAAIYRAQNNPFANALGTIGGAAFGFGGG